MFEMNVFFLKKKNNIMKNNGKNIHLYDILYVLTWFVMHRDKIVDDHFPWLNHYQDPMKAKTLKTKVASN